MNDKRCRKIKFYLHNYYNIDKLIEERKECIIESISPTSRTWLMNGNTLENQTIKLIEDWKIIEQKIEQQIVSPQQSKSFRKKMVRIQREKERKERERRKKNGEDISLDVSTIEVTEEQANQLLLKYSESKKNQQVRIEREKNNEIEIKEK